MPEDQYQSPLHQSVSHGEGGVIIMTACHEGTMPYNPRMKFS